MPSSYEFMHYFDKERASVLETSTCLIQALRGKRYTGCYPIDLEREGFQASIFFLCCLYTIGMLMFHRRFVGEILAKLVLSFSGRYAPGVKLAESERKKARKIGKFQESFVEFTFYSCFLVMGVIILSQQSWVWPSNKWYENTPQYEVEAHVVIFTFFYAARYAALLFALLFVNSKKKDFLEMVIHHVVTVVLIITALQFGFIRIGLVIMVLFDAADPFLHVAKLFNYAKKATKIPESDLVFGTYPWAVSQITDIFLGIFAVVFTLSRIVVFSYIVYSVSYESYVYYDCNSAEECSFLRGLEGATLGHHVCVLLVWVIYALQWVWFRLLVKVIYKFLVLGIAEDNRSDSDDSQVERKKKRAENKKKFQEMRKKAFGDDPLFDETKLSFPGMDDEEEEEEKGAQNGDKKND